MTKTNSSGVAPRTQARSRRSIRRRTRARDVDRCLNPPPPAKPPRRRQSNRRIKPRKPDDYTNEEYGWLHGEPDSRSIAHRNREKIPKTVDPWDGSKAQQRLKSRPGLWIPSWVGFAAQHPVRARVLAWLLDRFENVDAHSDQCRATIVDAEGVRWWATSRQKIAQDTRLDAQAVKRALIALTKKGLIEKRSNRSRGTWLRPIAKPLLRARNKYVGEGVHTDEIKMTPDDLQWHESAGRDLAMDRSNQGVRVPHLLMAICDDRPGPSLVLSHLTYWACRSQITRRDHDENLYLWVSKSCRDLADELGCNKNAAQNWLDWLAERGYLVIRYWVYNGERDYGQPTQHIRLATQTIDDALADHDDDDFGDE